MPFWDKWVKPKEPPPADRSKTMLSGGGEVPKDGSHKQTDHTTGLQKGYIVLTPEERSKGFVRPLRRTYLHKTCMTTTRMSLDISETYARDPYFYNATYCCACKLHLPLTEFVWEGTNIQVGQ